MDVIAMQVANKALKKINTEYNGFCYTYNATDGQTEVVSQKSFDAEGYTLKVYVDGVRAIKDRDYRIVNNTTIAFLEPLRSGDAVTLSTDIAGVPNYTIMYDDTDIKREVANIKGGMVTVNGEIANIKNALDEDGDGSILDTIANIKKEWEDADKGLKKLIDGKVDTADFNALETSLEELKNTVLSLVSSVADKASAEQLGVVASSLETQISKVGELKAKVEVMEKKELSDFGIKDSHDGRKYAFTLVNGAIVPVLNHTVMSVSSNLAAEVFTSEPVEFELSVIANQDSNTIAKAKFDIPANIILEYDALGNGNWVRVDEYLVSNENTFTIMDRGFKLRVTATTDGDYSIGCTIIKADTSCELSLTNITFRATGRVIPPAIGPSEPGTASPTEPGNGDGESAGGEGTGSTESPDSQLPQEPSIESNPESRGV